MADRASLERLVATNSIGAVDLKFAGADGGDSEWLCRVLRALRSNRSVASLDMWGTLLEMHPQASDRCASQLHAALRQNTALCVLDLGQNSLGDAGCSRLAEAVVDGAAAGAPLQRLVLSHNSLTERAGTALAALVSGARCLQHLELKSNQLGNVAAAAIAKALAQNRALISLSLAHNSIGARGGAALLAALETNAMVQSIELKNNLLGKTSSPGGRVQLQVDARCQLNSQRSTVANPSPAMAVVANPPVHSAAGFDESSSDSEPGGALGAARPPVSNRRSTAPRGALGTKFVCVFYHHFQCLS